MNTFQLRSAIEQDEKLSTIMGGVLPADAIPFVVAERPKIYIINTEKSSEKGEHWLTFFFPENMSSPAEMFDSLAEPPSQYGTPFIEFLKLNSSTFICSKKKIQGDWSTSCGYYSLFFAILRSREMALDQIEQIFGSNMDKNDAFVTYFIKNYF